MNTERLLEFQVLAQTLHYGTAASRLYISQSVLSRHIQSLEKELGVKLFTRSSHNVALTSAGIAFYRLSQDFLKDAHHAADVARVASMGITGSVKAGFLLPTMSARIRDFLKLFDERYPDIFVSSDVLTDINVVHLEEYHYITLGSLAMPFPDCFELYHKLPEKGCLIFPLNSQDIPDNPVSLKELTNKTLFLPGYNRTTGSFARIGQLARQATDDHVHIVPVVNPETAILNVELGRGYTILPKHRASYSSQQFRYSDLTDDCYFETMFMRNTNFDSDADRLFGEEFIKILERN